jgi:hypothetical protein
MADNESEVRTRLMEAVRRAIANSPPSKRSWHVCVKTPDDDDLFSFTLGSYQEVERLAAELRTLGYHLKLLHPVHTHCDFVLEPDPAAY